MLDLLGPVCTSHVLERFLALTRQAGCYLSLVYFHRSPFAFLAWPFCHGLCPSSGAIYVAEVSTDPPGKSLQRPDGLFKTKVFPLPYTKDFKWLGFPFYPSNSFYISKSIFNLGNKDGKALTFPCINLYIF